jgi:hypothetical protein
MDVSMWRMGGAGPKWRTDLDERLLSEVDAEDEDLGSAVSMVKR